MAAMRRDELHLEFDKLISILKSHDEDKMAISLMKQRLFENQAMAQKLFTMTDRYGQTPLQAAILFDASPSKLNLILGIERSMARVRHKGRLPLHQALESAREETAAALIKAWPASVRIPDQDNRLPLHAILEKKPFPSGFVSLAQSVLEKHPEAAHVVIDGKLPLHMCVEYSLPPRLILDVLEKNRAAAGLPRGGDGKFPLHMAVELDLDVRVISALVEAHPAALLQKMPSPQGASLVLEVAMKNNRPQDVIKCLLFGGRPEKGPSSAKSAAYARAAATRRLTKFSTLEQHLATSTEDLRPKYGKQIRIYVKTRWTDNNKQVIHSFKQREIGVTKDENGFVQQINAAGPARVKGIEEGDQIVKVDAKPYSNEYEVTVVKKPMVVDINPALKVDDLKTEIALREGTPAVEQLLTLDGKQLFGNNFLLSSGVVQGCTIELRERFELFPHALRYGAQKALGLELLKLRPEYASEEDCHGVLPLAIATQCRAAETVVLKLLELHPAACKVDVGKFRANTGVYPLHVALEQRYSVEVIKVMLKGTRASDWTKEGFYNPNRLYTNEFESHPRLPLHIAIETATNLDIVKLLLQSCCPISAREKTSGHNALEHALVCGLPDDVFDLVLAETKRANPKFILETGERGHMPLHIAVWSGASERIVSKICVQYPPALEKADVDGRLPIHLAVVRRTSFHVVRVLLEAAPHTVTAMDHTRRTPLLLAVTHRVPPGVVFEIIRTDHTTLQARGHGGKSVLQLAVQSNAPISIVQELLEADPSLFSSIDLLADIPNTKASAEILRLAMDVQQKQARGQTPAYSEPPAERPPAIENSSSSFGFSSWFSAIEEPPKQQQQQTVQQSQVSSNSWYSSWFG